MSTQNSSRSGTERVARRARQATNAEQATKDALLVPPTGGAKKAAAAAKKQTELARFGGDTPRTVRKAKQTENARKADEENVTLAAPRNDSARILLGLVPGEQPTNRQLRLLAKAHQGNLRDEATEAGKAAGRVVRDTLLGRNTRATPHSRHRRAASAQDALQQAAANAAK